MENRRRKELRETIVVLFVCAALFGVWRIYCQQTRNFIDACENHPQIQALIAEVEQSVETFISSLPYKKTAPRNIFDLPGNLENEEMREAISAELNGLRDIMDSADAKNRILVLIREIHSKMEKKDRWLIGEKAIDQAYDEIAPLISEIYIEAQKRIVLLISCSWP